MTTVNKLQKAILEKLRDEQVATPTLVSEQKPRGTRDYVIIENGRARGLSPQERRESRLWVKESVCVATKVEEAAKEAAQFTQKLFTKFKLASPNGNAFQEMLKMGTLIGNYIYLMKEKECIQK
jgi:hypothetical protein